MIRFSFAIGNIRKQFITCFFLLSTLLPPRKIYVYKTLEKFTNEIARDQHDIAVFCHGFGGDVFHRQREMSRVNCIKFKLIKFFFRFDFSLLFAFAFTCVCCSLIWAKQNARFQHIVS